MGYQRAEVPAGSRRTSFMRLSPSRLRPSVNRRVPPIVYEALREPGVPLDAGTRSLMERRFSHDFAHVRVHTDERAAASARAVNALAYTVGGQLCSTAGAMPRTKNRGAPYSRTSSCTRSSRVGEGRR